MRPSVKLNDLTDALDMSSSESSAWLDRHTGRVWIIQSHLFDAADSGNPTAGDSLADWEKPEFDAARTFLADINRGIKLPTAFDFHEYRHMERFIGTLTHTRDVDTLWQAIKSRGAFRRFKDTAHRLGVLDAWYTYRNAALRRFMLDWAHTHQIPVDESPTQGTRP
jgi:Uncharacterised protein family (UPF0158)